jgi:hypothetical protein
VPPGGNDEKWSFLEMVMSMDLLGKGCEFKVIPPFAMERGNWHETGSGLPGTF